MIDPRQTIVLLRELRALGFDDDALWRLHHFRNRGFRENIHRFSAYCLMTSYFRAGGANERVHNRLQFVLDAYRSPNNRLGFEALADLAFAKIPPIS